MATTKRSTRRRAAPDAASSRDTRSAGPLTATLSGVADSVQQVWLAGLGALGRAQSEGSRLFEALAGEGREVQDRALHRVGERADALLETLLRVRARTVDIELSTQSFRITGDPTHVAERDAALQ